MERTFVTAVDPHDPLKGNHRVWALDVYYDLDCDGDVGEQLTRMDELADELATVQCVGSGAGSGVRDREYHFLSEAAMREAKERLRDGGFRFYCHEQCLT